MAIKINVNEIHHSINANAGHVHHGANGERDTNLESQFSLKYIFVDCVEENFYLEKKHVQTVHVSLQTGSESANHCVASAVNIFHFELS